MRFTVVGSGTAVPEPDRVCSGYFVEAGDTRLLLDCGPGVVHRMAELGLPWSGLDHVFISHFHNDHVGDLPMLLFALKWGVTRPRARPLTLWGPRGLHERLRAMEAAFGDHVADPGFPLGVREFTPRQGGVAGDVAVRATSTPHTEHSLAFRLESGDARLGYTGDTGPSEEVASFLAGVDVLVAECSLPDEDAFDLHLSPSSLADMARTAGPGRLVVTHVYPRLSARGVVGLVEEAGWADGETLRAHDGLRLEI